MPDESQKLELSFTFNAPVQVIWDAWTKPELFAQWYGWPGKLQGTVIDAVVGGTWEAATVMDSGATYPQKGVFTAIHEPQHLSFNFVDPDNPTDPDFEMMDVTFTPQGDKTVMTFVQTGRLPAEEYNIGLRVGWTGFFNRLATVVKGGTTI